MDGGGTVAWAITIARDELNLRLMRIGSKIMVQGLSHR